MRVPLKELMEKLGIDRELHPYETQPWLHYDDDQGITCSAEVRMSGGADYLEAEIQFLYDDDTEIPELYVEEDEDEKKGSGSGDEEKPKKPLIINGRMQVMIMRAEPVTDDKWGPRKLMVKGLDYVNAFHDWEGKACNFFVACIQAINMGELPDIDSLIDKELSEDGRGGRGRRGRIGRKGLKMAQNNPHNSMKKGM